jgi:ubiquinone/menaquinone biosynthesis C-methylase UbiE
VSVLDVATVKEQQRETWDGVSDGWEDFAELFERGAEVVTARLLELAGLRAGQSVLDVGCGQGEPALAAADAVGPQGWVLGVDLAPRMVAVARRRAGGRRNVTFRLADVEALDLPARSFDAVLSRWGLMFACDHLSTFRSLARLLRPRGVLAAAVWGEAADVPMISLGYQVISRELQLPPPPPGLPGPFSMADPERLVADLVEAGFGDVSVSPQVVPFEVGSTAEFVSFTRAVTPPSLRRLLAERLDPVEEEAVWSAVREAAAAFRSHGALRLRSTTWCLRAVAPADDDPRRAHG